VRNAPDRPYDSTIMKFSPMTGALVLSAGLAGGVFAAPAQADSASAVEQFLSTLDILGISGIDPGRAVAIGQSLCPMLAEGGQSTADLASTVSDAIGRPLGPATMFTGAAISFLCPRAVENVTSDLANGKLPLPLFG